MRNQLIFLIISFNLCKLERVQSKLIDLATSRRAPKRLPSFRSKSRAVTHFKIFQQLLKLSKMVNPYYNIDNHIDYLKVGHSLQYATISRKERSFSDAGCSLSNWKIFLRCACSLSLAHYASILRQLPPHTAVRLFISYGGDHSR